MEEAPLGPVGLKALRLLVCVWLTVTSPTQVNQQRQKLHDLQNLIDNLNSSKDQPSDAAFEERLREAERAIMELLEEAQTSKGTTVCPLHHSIHHHHHSCIPQPLYTPFTFYHITPTPISVYHNPFTPSPP